MPNKHLPFLLYFALPAFPYVQALESTVEEEIVVTSRMRSENILEVPISIHVINSDTISMYGDSLQDMETAVPSLGFGRAGRKTRGEISIRGVGDFARNIGTESRVSVYLDSVLVGRSSAFDQELGGIERIEILKGPQGSLYGANSIAGTINIISKAPTDELNFSVTGTHGNQNSELGLSTNIPINNTIQSNVFFRHKDEDGYIDNLHINRVIGKTTTQSGHTRTSFHIEKHNIQADLSIYLTKQTSNGSDSVALPGGAFGGYTAAPDERKVVHDTLESEERHLFGVNLNTFWTLNSFSLTQLVGYRDNEHQQTTDQDYSSLDIASSASHEQLEQYSYELRLATQESESFYLVSGIYYLNQDIHTNSRANGGTLFPSPNSSVSIPSSVDLDSFSFYTTSNINLSEAIKATIGARLISEQRNILYTSIDTTGLFINVNDIFRRHTTKKWVPSMQLAWHQGALMTYASVSAGHKSAGWNADAIQSMEHFDFNAESAINYELGIKSGFENWHYSLTGYVIEYKDFQVFQIVPTSDTGSVITITNAAEVISQGLEIDSTFEKDGLTYSVAIAYNEAEFNRFKDAGGEGKHYDGNRLPYSPHLNISMSLSSKTKISDNTQLQSSITYSYTGSYYSDPSNSTNTFISDRDTVNVSSTLIFHKNTKIKLWVKNLFDQTHLRSSGESFLREPRGVYEPPRSFGVALTHDF